MDYLAAVTMLKKMISEGLIDEADYQVLEQKYAETFQAHYRFKAPSILTVSPVNSEGTGGGPNAKP